MLNSGNLINLILYYLPTFGILFFVVFHIFDFFKTSKFFKKISRHHQKNRIITARPLDEVLEREYYTKLAEYLLEAGKSRRDIPDYITTKLYDPNNEFYDVKGNRIEFDPDEVEEAFGDDPSYKWFSEFYNIRHTGWKQKPSIRVHRRLELISMARQTEVDED